MERYEIAELLAEIEMLYPRRFTIEDQNQFDTYAKVLAPHDAKQVMKNLYAHVSQSEFPPSVANLVKKQEVSTVPNVEQTHKYLEKFGKAQADPEVVEEESAKIKKLLGINR